MSEELQAEVVVPPPEPRRRRVAVPIACGVGGAALGAITAWLCIAPEVRLSTVVLPAPCPPPVDVPAPPPPAPVPLPDPPADVAFVLSVGGDTYVEIETQELPRTGTPNLVADDPLVRTAIAEVAAKNLPADVRAWAKRTISIDASCEARVTGFAVIGRATGSAHDANEDLTEWNAATVLEYGRPALFARVDGCSGTFARDAARPAITVLAETSAPGDLAERARDSFTSSKLVIDAQTAWREAGEDGTWYESAEGHIETRVMRHPRTGAMWVVVHGFRYNDCGQLGGNVVGLYRVNDKGRLETVVERGAGFQRLEQVIDLEGDGALELVGSSKDYVTIERTGGDTVRSLAVAAYGCGC